MNILRARYGPTPSRSEGWSARLVRIVMHSRVMDAIPFLSQTKSLFQAVCFDFEGARRTQENFSRQCPVVSQIRSTCEWAQGDSKAARETQEQCLGFLSDIVDGIPAVGHVKGGIHYAFGDKDGGDKAMKSASRTTGVMGGGVVGFFAGGPIGAAAGGVAGGLAMDGLTTGIDSAVHKEYRPSGMVAQVTEIAKDPKNPGVWFDTMAIPVFDAMTGVSAGKGAARIANKIKAKRLYNKNKATITRKVGKANYKKIKSTADMARKKVRKGATRGAKKHAYVVSRAQDLKTGKTYTGKNLEARPKGSNAKNNMSGLKGRTKSNLQKKVPNAQKVLNRDPRSCAEHQAVNKLYKDRPSAKPSEIRTCTVIEDAKTGKIRALKRCDNCMQFGDGVGSQVPTDEIAGMVIVEDPGYPMSKKGAAMVGGSIALAAMKQANNGSTKASKPREKTDDEVKTSKQQVTVVSGKSGDESSKEETPNELKIVTKTSIYVKTKKVCRKYRTYRGRVGYSKMKQYSIVVKQSRGSKDCVKVAGNQSDDSCVHVMNETGSQENLYNQVDENNGNKENIKVCPNAR